jgi:hypothetical protein
MQIHSDDSYHQGIVAMPGQLAYTFSVETADDMAGLQSAFSGNWETDPQTGGGYRVVPFGSDNNLPALLRDVLDQNNLAEGILSRKRGLMWGNGPELYTKKYVDGKPIREWVDDKEVNTWMKSWNGAEYLRRCLVDYLHAEVVSTKIFRNRGSRLGGSSSKIARLEHITCNESRLQWPEDGNGLVVADWENQRYGNLKYYPAFDPADPLRYPVAGHFSNLYSFARKFYGVPAWFGAINWIRRASAIPRILENLTNNSLAIKWHVISPQSYWTAKEEQLKALCAEKKIEYTDKMLRDLKDETFKKLGAVLAGEKNVGKFFTSESIPTEMGNGFEKWEIVPIDQKVKDYIDAQISVSNKADSATTSGIGLHPSLSNIMIDGKLASGSEQLYALKIFLATETTIPEDIVCDAINQAIAVNWPGKNLRIGFYHQIVMTEDQVSPKDRVKNAT